MCRPNHKRRSRHTGARIIAKSVPEIENLSGRPSRFIADASSCGLGRTDSQHRYFRKPNNPFCHTPQENA